jgi:hypothetical protein
MQTCSTSLTVELLTAVTVMSAVFSDVCCHILEDCVLHGYILLVVLLMVTTFTLE